MAFDFYDTEGNMQPLEVGTILWHTLKLTLVACCAHELMMHNTACHSEDA